MNSWIDTIESSALPVWVRESPSMFAYTHILTWHAIGLSLVVGINVIVALRLLGFVPAIPLPTLRKLSVPMYIGFWINAVSGSMLLAAALHDNLKNLYFGFKLLFIALAIVNLEYTRRRVFTDPAMQRNEVPALGRRVAWLALAFWTGAIVCGRITEYPGIVGNLFGIH
jgi:hypothetical protein